jgi:hypothetical protein
MAWSVRTAKSDEEGRRHIVEFNKDQLEQGMLVSEQLNAQCKYRRRQARLQAVIVSLLRRRGVNAAVVPGSRIAILIYWMN